MRMIQHPWLLAHLTCRGYVCWFTYCFVCFTLNNDHHGLRIKKKMSKKKVILHYFICKSLIPALTYWTKLYKACISKETKGVLHGIQTRVTVWSVGWPVMSSCLECTLGVSHTPLLLTLVLLCLCSPRLCLSSLASWPAAIFAAVCAAAATAVVDAAGLNHRCQERTSMCPQRILRSRSRPTWNKVE